MEDSSTTAEDPSRTREMARSFYAELSAQGFTTDEVVDLATTLLDLVHGELLPAGPQDRQLPKADGA